MNVQYSDYLQLFVPLSAWPKSRTRQWRRVRLQHGLVGMTRPRNFIWRLTEETWPSISGRNSEIGSRYHLIFYYYLMVYEIGVFYPYFLIFFHQKSTCVCLNTRKMAPKEQREKTQSELPLWEQRKVFGAKRKNMWEGQNFQKMTYPIVDPDNSLTKHWISDGNTTPLTM